jgi:hypothetical protein
MNSFTVILARTFFTVNIPESILESVRVARALSSALFPSWRLILSPGNILLCAIGVKLS